MPLHSNFQLLFKPLRGTDNITSTSCGITTAKRICHSEKNKNNFQISISFLHKKLSTTKTTPMNLTVKSIHPGKQTTNIQKKQKVHEWNAFCEVQLSIWEKGINIVKGNRHTQII